jgi:hypothetical protein
MLFLEPLKRDDNEKAWHFSSFFNFQKYNGAKAERKKKFL